MEYSVLFIGVGIVTVVNIICTAIIVSRSQVMHKKRGMTQHYHLDVDSTDLLPEEEMTAVRTQAREKMERAFGDTFAHLDQSLVAMAESITLSAEKQFSAKLNTELSKFEANLGSASGSVQAVVENTTKQFNAGTEAMRLDLEAAVTKEKERRIADFEQRMSTVISSYIADSFNGNQTMITQTDLIVEWLNQHKDEIRKDLA